MTQADMSMEKFKEIITSHVRQYGVPPQISLQGEGEPTLVKDFFNMAAVVKDIGSEPYTITNGTHKHPERFIPLFNRIGVSVDTLDAAFATKIGRHNLPRTLEFIEQLRRHIPITIYTVAVAKDIPNIAQYCRDRGLKHIVQPLQRKPDYSYRYQKLTLEFERPEPFSCSYLRNLQMRYYDYNGKKMPCCFIKNGAQAPAIEEMQAMEQKQEMPEVCRGCHFGVARAV